MKYPQHFKEIIEVLRQFPGVGTKTAERFAFQMLGWSSEKLARISDVIRSIPEKLQTCPQCGCIQEEKGCLFCQNPRRDKTILCVVSSIRDVFAIEETGEFAGLYHVLDGLLSPMEGKTSEILRIDVLEKRIHSNKIKEVVLALDSTLEGDATALFLKRELEKHSLNISRPAFGIPLGSSLDFVDSGTLTRAIQGRRQF